MKKILISFFLLATLVGCSSSHDKKLVGTWRDDLIGTTGFNFYKDGTFDLYMLGELYGKEYCKWSTSEKKLTIKCEYDDYTENFEDEYEYSLDNNNQHLNITLDGMTDGFNKEN